MSKSPIIEFGLAAINIAYQARNYQVLGWDVVRFSALALRCVPEDELARAAVLKFSESVRANGQRAGMMLLADTFDWLDTVSPAHKGEIENTANSQFTFDWQRRADLQ